MLLGRAGALGYFIKKRKDKQKKEGGKETKKQQLLRDYQENYQKQLGKKEYIFYKKHPKGAWFLGIVMGCASSILLYFIMVIKPIEFEDPEGMSNFWRYFISIMLMVFSFVFLVNGYITSVEINLELKIVIKEKKNLCCCREAESRDLENLKDIRILKRGRETFEQNSIHYVIIMEFEEEEPLEIMEEDSVLKIKKKYVEIQTYLKKKIDFDSWIQVKDESYSSKKEKQKLKEEQEKKNKELQKIKQEEDNKNKFHSLEIQGAEKVKKPFFKRFSKFKEDLDTNTTSQKNLNQEEEKDSYNLNENDHLNNYSKQKSIDL